MKILFLNHKRSRCGVYWYGFRLFNIWKKSAKFLFEYREIHSLTEYNCLPFDEYVVIIYNYCCLTMPWLNELTLNKQIKSLGIFHESYITCHFDKIIAVEHMPRPIFEKIPNEIETKDNGLIQFLTYEQEGTPIIGSFGFGFECKGFEQIVSLVCSTYEKAIIKLIVTIAEFGDDAIGSRANSIINYCKSLLTNKNVELLITTEFLSDNDILYFLNKNTVNAFFYKEEPGRTLSSVIDFAFSVNKPVCLTNSFMFKHVYSDEISINRGLIMCSENKLDYISKFKAANSHEISVRYIESILNEFKSNI